MCTHYLTLLTAVTYQVIFKVEVYPASDEASPRGEPAVAEQHKHDLAQRIAEAVNATTPPREISTDDAQEGDVLLGVVPIHLRHLNNLITDLIDAEKAASEAGDEALVHLLDRQYNVVKDLFFRSLEEHIPTPEEAGGIKIGKDWNVYAMPMCLNPLAALFGNLPEGRLQILAFRG